VCRLEMIEAHQGRVETACDFAETYGFVRTAAPAELQTSTGARFTVQAATSGSREVIRFYQRGREHARAYPCCWGRYYNCNRTRIGMYCAALDSAAKAWFEWKVAELKTGLKKLPADRQEQLRRELGEG
jgi:hypothetical protein